MRLQSILTLFSLYYVCSTCAKLKNKVSLQWAICDQNPQIVLVLEKLDRAGAQPDKLDPISYYDTNPPVYTT